MATVALTKWGNSLGLRVPIDICKQAHAYVGEQFEVAVKANAKLVFTPVSGKPRDGWLHAFNLASDQKVIDKDLAEIENDFDKDEWEW